MKIFAGIAALGGANGLYLSELDRNGTLQELTPVYHILYMH